MKKFVIADNANLEEIIGKLNDNGEIKNPKDVQIGYVQMIHVNERERKDGGKFNQIQIDIRNVDNAKYNKRYSVDFFRKYLNQLECKAKDLSGVVCVFKPTGEYRNIGWLGFVYIEKEDEEFTYKIVSYQDEATDWVSALTALGL